MRIHCIILFAVCLSLLGSPKMVRGQATIHGRVTDANTGQPLPNVNVYLSGTKIGTATNIYGEYRLRQIPAGGHRLVVSRIGYSRSIEDIVIGPSDTRKMNVELTPVIYELPEIYAGAYNKKWKSNLERFTELFIGETKWADSVKILNPRVLRFENRWWGKFTAEALAPLEIENRALGYRIRYYLTEFNHSGGRTRWDGEPLFSEMTPQNAAQAAYWKKNRREAFYGSLRHFLLALLENRTREEGFVLYNQRESVYGFSPQDRSRISGRRLIREGKENYLYRLNFFGRLEIIYTEAQEDARYVQWLGNSSRRAGSAQTSYLKLNKHPITVDADGEIVEPYGATQFGYYAYSRLADATPREYRPEEYRDVSLNN